MQNVTEEVKEDVVVKKKPGPKPGTKKTTESKDSKAVESGEVKDTKPAEEQKPVEDKKDDKESNVSVEPIKTAKKPNHKVFQHQVPVYAAPSKNSPHRMIKGLVFICADILERDGFSAIKINVPELGSKIVYVETMYIR